MRSLPLLLAPWLLLTQCGPSDPQIAGRTPIAEKWLTRAKTAYKAGDFDDAEQSATSGVGVAPRDSELRTLKAKIALARLEYADAIKWSEAIESTEALGIRGRALFYAGRLEEAADTLDVYLRDPAVKDPWARDISRLARGAGTRHPFEVEGGLVGVVEMPDAGHAAIVPCELDGERILAMVATSSAELVVDSSTRKEPSWVSLRFGDRFEVRDVPALTQDLTALSTKLGAPIKALIGMEVLRHLHATLDRRGDQFVVRKEDPAAPPEASRIPLWYLRGGALLMKANVAAKDGNATFLVDSAQPFLLSLTDTAWQRAGVRLSDLKGDPALPADVKTANLSYLKVASFDFSGAPGLQGIALEALPTDVDLAGVFGAALLSSFRITFIEDGKSAWLEPDPNVFVPRGGAAKDPLEETAPVDMPLLPPLRDPSGSPPKAKEGGKTDGKAGPKADPKADPKSDPKGDKKPTPPKSKP